VPHYVLVHVNEPGYERRLRHRRMMVGSACALALAAFNVVVGAGGAWNVSGGEAGRPGPAAAASLALAGPVAAALTWSLLQGRERTHGIALWAAAVVLGTVSFAVAMLFAAGGR
jgi:hypothetical protein